MQYIFKLIKILCGVILLSIYAIGNSSVLANSKNNQNTLKLSIPDSPSTLDPTYSLDAHANEILLNLFEGLVVRDINGNMVPGVAESWTNKDNKIWTFKLRKNAKWSDGKSVTAHDFVYSFQRIADPKTATPLAGSLIEIGYKNAEAIAKGELPVSALGVKALDDYTVEIALEKSIPYFIEIAGIVPLRKDIIEKYGDRWTRPENFISNGAYKLDELILQEKVVLSKNPYYWDNKNTSIDKVVYLVISDDNIAYNRFKIGEIDIVNVNTPKNLYERAKKDYPANLDVYPRLGIFYLGVNVKKIPNKKVRQALQLGVDREVITNKILATGQKPAYNYVPYNIKGANFAEPEWAKWTAKQRYAKAKRLLAEAGFNKNRPFNLTLTYASGVVSLDH
ncbi:peptide ABC transporter substrate-binding protein [Bartonella sp. DGB1]|uniref:peptide ABC transporter substrate-binding protein n=1 Tax=Bartonella sp. DGB1 TaxID=3239807 RepID=UPI003524051F